MKEDKRDFKQKNQPPKQPKPKEKAKEIHHHHYKEKREIFTPGRFFIGLLIIFIGLLFLAQNAGWLKVSLYFNWGMIWPIIVILIGLSLISFRGWLGAVLGILITLVIAGLILLIIFGQFSFSDQEGIYEEVIAIAKEAQAQSALIEIKTGAGQLTIRGGSTALLSGSFESNFLELDQRSQLKDDLQEITLATTGKWTGKIGKKWNDLVLQLSSEIPIKLYTDTGAISIDLDLTEVMLEELDIDTGASSLEIVLGDKLDQTRVNIDAGASSINIKLPKTVGAEVFIDAGLTSKNLKDFKQINSDHYQSDNFDTTTKKITLDLNLGVSSLNIGWK